MNERKLILVCNDDGITAPGIRNLIEVVKEFGEVVVVAPDKPQSAMGHAITINSTLRIHPFKNGEIREFAHESPISLFRASTMDRMHPSMLFIPAPCRPLWKERLKRFHRLDFRLPTFQ